MYKTFQIHRFSELSNSEFLSPRVGTQKHAPHPADSPRKRRQRQHVKETDEQDTLKAASPIHTVAPTSLTPPHVPKIDVFEVFDVHRINSHIRKIKYDVIVLMCYLCPLFFVFINISYHKC